MSDPAVKNTERIASEMNDLSTGTATLIRFSTSNIRHIGSLVIRSVGSNESRLRCMIPKALPSCFYNDSSKQLTHKLHLRMNNHIFWPIFFMYVLLCYHFIMYNLLYHTVATN